MILAGLYFGMNHEPAAYETVKMLLGGDTLSVNKKYEDYVEMYGTPIIMLTNNEVLNRDPVWTDRCFFLYVEAFGPLAKQCS